jgi:hypothetical protein
MFQTLLFLCSKLFLYLLTLRIHLRFFGAVLVARQVLYRLSHASIPFFLFVCVCVCVCVLLELKLGAYTLSQSTSPFYVRYFLT